MEYAKTLAKVQASAIFGIREYREKCFTSIHRHLTPLVPGGGGEAAGAHPDGQQDCDRKAIKTSVTEFCY